MSPSCAFRPDHPWLQQPTALPRFASLMAHSGGFESPTAQFVYEYSIQLSYECAEVAHYKFMIFLVKHFALIVSISTKRQEPNHYLDNAIWRRGGDSNPRHPFEMYSLSRGAPSATRPPLRNTGRIIPIFTPLAKPKIG